MNLSHTFITWLSSTDLLMKSPILALILLLVVTKMTTKHGKSVFRRFWKYAKSGLIAYILFFAVKLIWENYFPTTDLFIWNMTTVISTFATALNFYIMYLSSRFLLKARKSLKFLWAFAPFIPVILGNLISFIK